ncbi:MAG: ribosomal L7Ae/L30e/S12e/Gadd45 family protein [Butyricicoccus sp.]|nr:ribosomal L7Ae/L30e/S12e/Gadd45 family protein [Butyricicoccus sp.]MBQ8585901.1 ribosomal L7Ae/L30e/S12e/Gadd45 family protein [Butyricicoccus sp.]
MATDRLLGLLGLARRAGKLEIGEALTAETVAAGKARAIFLASDVGEATRRKVLRHEERVPVLTVPYDKETLGASLGFPGCAVCCLTDVGMARAAAEQLAPLSEANAAAAARVAEKEARIASRKGIKKKKKTTAPNGTKQ